MKEEEAKLLNYSLDSQVHSLAVCDGDVMRKRPARSSAVLQSHQEQRALVKGNFT